MHCFLLCLYVAALLACAVLCLSPRAGGLSSRLQSLLPLIDAQIIRILLVFELLDRAQACAFLVFPTGTELHLQPLLFLCPCDCTVVHPV